MISNCVHEAFDYAQYKLYQGETSLAGVNANHREEKAERIATNQNYFSFSYLPNPHPTITRIAAVPIALIDVLFESLRPLFLIVESVAFTTISLLSFLWNAVRLRFKETETPIRMTLINFHDVIYHTALAVGRVATAPLFAIAQMIKIIADPQAAVPSTHNFGSRKLSPEVIRNLNVSHGSTKDGLVKKAYNYVEHKLYEYENGYAYSVRHNHVPQPEPEAILVSKRNYQLPSQQVNRNHQQMKSIEIAHPIMSRVYGIPLAALDVILEVVKPFIATIASLTLATGALAVSLVAVAILPFSLPLILDNKQQFSRCFTYAFYQLDEAVTSLAETVTNAALSPLTFISQLLIIWWDPKVARPSIYNRFYEPKLLDTSFRFGGKIERKNLTGIDQCDWSLVQENKTGLNTKSNHATNQEPSEFLKQNYNQYFHQPSFRRNRFEENHLYADVNDTWKTLNDNIRLLNFAASLSDLSEKRRD